MWQTFGPALVTAILFRRTGEKRAFGWWLLFDAAGRMRPPLRRGFFKGSGAIRPWVPADLAESLNAPGLRQWIAVHDTPDAATLSRIVETAELRPSVRLMVHIAADADVPPLAAAVAALVGVRFDVAIACAPGASVTTARAAFGATVADPGTAAPEFIVVIQSGAIPRPHALRLLVDALHTGVHLVYGDEATLDRHGDITRPWFKPDWSPVLAARGVLLGRMVGLRLAGGADGMALYDRLAADADPQPALLAFTASLPPGSIRHLPHVLALNRTPPPPPRPEVLPPLPAPPPMVSILIPTRDGWPLLGPCLATLHATDWPRERLEILVIDNGSTDPACLQGLADATAQGRIRVIRDARPFNFAQLNNHAARMATGDLLVFLNNDTLARSSDWLRHLASHALIPGTGAVGPKLLYDDGTVQHAGVLLGVQGRVFHAHLGLAADAPGYQGLALMTHEVGAVTGACLAITRTAFDAVGGFDERFAVAFNDIVLCTDLLAAGYRNLFVAQPLFTHLESRSRGRGDSPEKRAREAGELALARSLHPGLFADDPFYSPNLSLDYPYATAARPRRPPVWAVPPVMPPAGSPPPDHPRHRPTSAGG